MPMVNSSLQDAPVHAQTWLRREGATQRARAEIVQLREVTRIRAPAGAVAQPSVAELRSLCLEQCIQRRQGVATAVRPVPAPPSPAAHSGRSTGATRLRRLFSRDGFKDFLVEDKDRGGSGVATTAPAERALREAPPVQPERGYRRQQGAAGEMALRLQCAVRVFLARSRTRRLILSDNPLDGIGASAEPLPGDTGPASLLEPPGERVGVSIEGGEGLGVGEGGGGEKRQEEIASTGQDALVLEAPESRARSWCANTPTSLPAHVPQTTGLQRASVLDSPAASCVPTMMAAAAADALAAAAAHVQVVAQVQELVDVQIAKEGSPGTACSVNGSVAFSWLVSSAQSFAFEVVRLRRAPPASIVSFLFSVSNLMDGDFLAHDASLLDVVDARRASGGGWTVVFRCTLPAAALSDRRVCVRYVLADASRVVSLPLRAGVHTLSGPAASSEEVHYETEDVEVKYEICRGPAGEAPGGSLAPWAGLSDVRVVLDVGSECGVGSIGVQGSDQGRLALRGGQVLWKLGRIGLDSLPARVPSLDTCSGSVRAVCTRTHPGRDGVDDAEGGGARRGRVFLHLCHAGRVCSGVAVEQLSDASEAEGGGSLAAVGPRVEVRPMYSFESGLVLVNC